MKASRAAPMTARSRWRSTSITATGFGLTRIGIHHQRLLPGHRSCYPHAESHEEEFVFVVEGEAMPGSTAGCTASRTGEAIAFPAGTGISHNFINNGAADMRMMVIGQRRRARQPAVLSAPRRTSAHVGRRVVDDAPQRPLGPHDGKADLRR